MQLLTKEIKNKIPPLYSTEEVPLEDKEFICKFFNPIGRGTWLVCEGEQVGDDYKFFGEVDLLEREWGYFYLSELESIKLPWGMKIERDILF